MKESFKCCLISMGIGFVVGAVVASNNKKVSNAMKEAKVVAMEKLEEAKDGLEKVKETIAEKIQGAQENQEGKKEVIVEGKNKSTQSKRKPLK